MILSLTTSFFFILPIVLVIYFEYDEEKERGVYEKNDDDERFKFTFILENRIRKILNKRKFLREIEKLYEYNNSSFEGAFKRMKERNWEKIYVLVDIHDTIFEACYHNKEEYKWFPYAKECLDIMSHAQQISLILWTSTYKNSINEYLGYFKANGISFDYVNCNSETENTDLSCFDEKMYFNVGIDDKFGFEPMNDWKELYDYLVESIRLGKFK